MTDEELWLKHIEEYPQIKTWSEEKREGARKGFKSGLAEGRKEIEQWKQEWQDAQIKANEEGFARTTLQIKCTNLEKEIEELKKKLCLMRKYIYGNYDLEYKEMQLQHIDEFGTELKVVSK